MAHLIVACKNLQVERYPGDVLGPIYHEVRPVTNPLHIHGPFVTCPTGPGLGVTIDWPAVQAHRCD